VLPRLRDALPNVVVRVAGRMEPALIEELRPISNLEVAPNPPSMDPHLGDATVVVAPIIASSGTRLRILEAWAAKRPVLTTTPGAFGLDCTTDEELVIRDEPAAFTDALVRMLESDAMRAGLVERASQRVKRYEWREIGNELRAAYARLSGERPLESVPVLSEEVALSAAL
jgi:glycosyltransferase involved in cell wall biosynthesis